MAVSDSVVFDVDVVAGAPVDVVPGVSGKRVRVWRALLTFDGADGVKGVMTWDAGSGDSQFFVQSGDRSIMGYEALAWANGGVGSPLTISVDAAISVKGTVRAEYVT